MKRYLKNFLLILFLSLIILPTTSAFAIAGGGHGGGGGHSSSSSSSHSSSSSSSSSSSHSYYGESNFPGSSIRYTSSGYYGGGYESSNKLNLSDILFLIFAFLTFGGGIASLKYKAKLQSKKYKCLSAISEFKKNDSGWDYDNLEKDITRAFYLVQEAWTERDQDIAKDYMSNDIYKLHKCKTEWMKIRGEKNILKDIKLLSITPVGALDSENNLKDMLWVNIKCSMIDYTINEKTNEIIEGNRWKSTKYEQFWKFKRNENHWVLDNIKWPDEIEDLNGFYNIKK